MSSGVTNPNEMLGDEAPPFVENAKLPKMEDRPVRPKRIRRSILRMSKEPDMMASPAESALKAGAVEGYLNLMEPVPSEGDLAGVKKVEAMPDQEELPIEEQRPETGYVRLRVRVENGAVSVVGIRTVEGPLSAAEKLHNDLSYEITRGQRLIAAGSIPDPRVMRGFPNPHGPPEQEAHSIVESPNYEFNVRIPRQEFSSYRALRQLRINVYRVKGNVPSSPITAEPLGIRFGHELRMVAQLDSIREENLPEALREDLRRVLR